MKPKNWRRMRRLERKVEEAMKRVNIKVRNRMDIMMRDEALIAEIDKEIEAEGGAKAFLAKQEAGDKPAAS